MLKNKFNLPFIFLGIFVGALSVNLLLPVDYHVGHSQENGSNAFHIHANFMIIANEQKIDLSDTKYMSYAGNILNKDVHLHDNYGEVIHFHAPNLTLVSFLESLTISLDNNCLEIDSEQLCIQGDDRLELYVNNDIYTGDLTTYIPEDKDRILLYYGSEGENRINEYLSEVQDDACIYSGTCPERGIAPPESCGLTCEL